MVQYKCNPDGQCVSLSFAACASPDPTRRCRQPSHRESPSYRKTKLGLPTGNGSLHLSPMSTSVPKTANSTADFTSKSKPSCRVTDVWGMVALSLQLHLASTHTNLDASLCSTVFSGISMSHAGVKVDAYHFHRECLCCRSCGVELWHDHAVHIDHLDRDQQSQAAGAAGVSPAPVRSRATLCVVLIRPVSHTLSLNRSLHTVRNTTVHCWRSATAPNSRKQRIRDQGLSVMVFTGFGIKTRR